ncbi:MAG TPA: DUF4126 domain-containing protein [Alphaproteobacteria bacterium]|nr:DUF4126 domain-containing protein [Alphaproteobacteria bacterium]
MCKGEPQAGVSSTFASEDAMDPVSIIALTMGIAWASGINLYAAVLMLGVMGATDTIALPPDLQLLASPIVIMAAALMYLVEFFADKVPGVDSGWDAIHTFIRIPAGAVLAAGAVGDVDPALAFAAALIGGTLAAGSHVTKASTRLAINASPEPFSNWTASIAEDVLVIAGLWTALHYPLVFLALLAVFIGLVVWLLPKLIRFVYRLFQRVAAWLRRDAPGAAGV